MNFPRRRRLGRLLAASIAIALSCGSGCRKADVVQRAAVLPQGTVLEDRSFYSTALGGNATYRVISPAGLQHRDAARVVYLLHGNGGSFREWSTSSSIAELARRGYVLVMPEGQSSYFMNPASGRGGRYEDFITQDLRADAERGLRLTNGAHSRSIVGVSMGGFAAIVIALKHPDLYGFAGALSPPVDYPRRRFTLRRWNQSLAIRSIFGPEGSAARSDNDPFVLAREANKNASPFMFLSVGDREGLREPVDRFEALLRAKGIVHELHLAHGGHDWQNWNSELPLLVTSLEGRQSSSVGPQS
jgi:putative tributyrin esterase